MKEEVVVTPILLKKILMNPSTVSESPSARHRSEKSSLMGWQDKLAVRSDPLVSTRRETSMAWKSCINLTLVRTGS